MSEKISAEGMRAMADRLGIHMMRDQDGSTVRSATITMLRQIAAEREHEQAGMTDEVVQTATQAFAAKLCADRDNGITQHHKAMRAALEAVAPMLRGVPDGWKLTPFEPTQRMIDKGAYETTTKMM